MGSYNKELIEEKLRVRVAESMAFSSNLNSDVTLKYFKEVKDIINRFGFSELEEMYEEGIKENTSSLPDDVFFTAVGYSMIMRFDLEYDEYEEWAGKQSPEKAYELFKLIGIEKEELKSATKNIVKEEKRGSNDDNEEYKNIINELELLPDVLCKSEGSEFEFIGHKYFVSEENEKVGVVLHTLRTAEEFADKTFRDELKVHCPDYKACSLWLSRIMDETLSAYWSKVKRALRKYGEEDEKLEKIREEFFENAISPHASEYLDEEFEKMYNVMSDMFEELKEEAIEQSQPVFTGGGFGLSGTIKGVIGAEILNGIHSGINEIAISNKAQKSKDIFFGACK